MTLKIKKTKINTNNNFSNKLNNERVYRSILITSKLFKEVKLKCLTQDKKIYDFLNDNLLKIIKQKIIKDINTLDEFKIDSKKRSFAIRKDVFNKIKLFCIENDFKIQNVIIMALKL